MKNIRSIIRKALHEESGSDGFKNVYPTSDKGNFPYSDGPARTLPLEIDPIAEYIGDWQALANNNDVYEFPTTEFNLGLRIERQRNTELTILEVADKVIAQLKDNSRFYSELRERDIQAGIAS